ncbi:MAG: FliM/FliN family flagellar motor switch protein [Spirochaetaceae bacterium]|nr:FliM/FliN family flagellar motor switch protein [Spirochaetaceae bacterium]
MKLGQIQDVKVKMEVVLGGAEYTVAEIAGIGEGTIIELNTLAGEPVELRAGGERIGLGEVVVIDESFGIRVTSTDSDDTRQES